MPYCHGTTRKILMDSGYRFAVLREKEEKKSTTKVDQASEDGIALRGMRPQHNPQSPAPQATTTKNNPSAKVSASEKVSASDLQLGAERASANGEAGDGGLSK
ncbi:hypothetical protein G7Y89_g12764 [Cudoniella acicularis]|uniref:Uncharacterized protein n=1 Tax=Cudoniella acicularis TaxID=354080 RepID=A0A8H4RC03_9HELO|nr:hypothetical protein G7Y89_g12764 [Cudoniella acicularis]